jgi:phosphate/phosphite/phosphonate ABC transporter binding protein
MASACERCGAALAAPEAPCQSCGAPFAPLAHTETVDVPRAEASSSAEHPTRSKRAAADTATSSVDPFVRPNAVIAVTEITDSLATDSIVGAIPLRDGARVLGGVRLLRKLGAGGMGAVYAGYHAVLEIEVAIKVLTARLEAGHEERFLREAKLSARIDHPNIVRTRDAGRDQGLLYIQMELIHGISAGELVRRHGRLSEAEAVAIVLDATRGLAEAHRCGVVHRDVKPDNILVLREALGEKVALPPGRVRAKLADLGLARAVREADAKITGDGSTLGTPAYMAPEQIEDASRVGPSADIYSMGATLYELLCGRPPFSAPTIPSLFREILSLPAPDPALARPDLSSPVREILRRTLEKAPGNRPSSAEELAKTLERALATAARDTPPVAPSSPAPPLPATPATLPPEPPVPSTAPPQTPRPRFRSSRRIAFLAGLAVAALVAGGRVAVTRLLAKPSLLVGILPNQRLTTERMKETEPLVEFLGNVTGRKVELVVSASYGDTVDDFVEGRTDLAHLGGVTYVLAKERLPSTIPLVQRVTDRLYRALFLASAASGVTKLSEVRSKRFAFVDPLSTSGYVVPAAMLLDAGIDPRRDLVCEFTHAHDATVDELAKGRVDAGVVDELVYYKLGYQQRLRGTKLTVLETSPPFPDDIWVARDTLDVHMRDALVRAFTALDAAKGKDLPVLNALEAEATHFVPARDSDYDSVRAMMKKLREKSLLGD